MTTPDPTDHDAAAAYTLACRDFVQEDLLARHFARHRMLRELLERAMCCLRLTEYANTMGLEIQAALAGGK